MNSLELARKIRRLNASWRTLLKDLSSETTTGQTSWDDSLQTISEDLARCTKDLEGRWSWDLTASGDAEGLGGQEGRVGAALRESVLAKEGLLGTAAAAALQKETLQITLKTQTLELCRVVVLSDGHFAAVAEPEFVEELVEICMGFVAVDFSHKVKRAALRLLRSAVAPEADGSPLIRGKFLFVDELPLRASAIERLLQRLSETLGSKGKKLGATVRSELFIVIAALLSRFRKHPRLTRPWLLPLLQQIAHRLDIARGVPTSGQTESLGALEALREILFFDKNVGGLLSEDIWGRIYAYAVTVGTQNVESRHPAQETGGKAAGVRGEAGTQSLQQAALAVLLEGAESFVHLIDRDVAADYAASATPPFKNQSSFSTSSSTSPQKGAESCTLLERLLALSASSNPRTAYNASRALPRIVRALCAAAKREAPAPADSSRPSEAEAPASPSLTAGSEAGISSSPASPTGWILECAAALRGFSLRVLAELQRCSLLLETAQVSQPDEWWQQCGCMGFVGYHCLPLFPSKERRLRGSTAAAACLRLSAAGCGSVWQQQHGPSCTKHALHLLSAAGAIIYRIVEWERSQRLSVSTPQSPYENPKRLKRRRLSGLAEQTPATQPDETYKPPSATGEEGQQPELLLSKAKGVGRNEITYMLPASLYTQLRKVSVTLFELHAKAGALPRSLVPKAAAAVGRAARALLQAAEAANEAAVEAAVGSLGGLGQQEAVETAEGAGHVEEGKDPGIARGAEPTAETEEADPDEMENSFYGGAAASALRRLVHESFLLALTENAVEPPTYVSVAIFWSSILGGKGQRDSLAAELEDAAYRRTLHSDSSSTSITSSGFEREKRMREEPAERLTSVLQNEVLDSVAASSWQLSLVQVLFEKFRVFLSGGVEAQMALQQGASSRLGAFTQAVSQTAGDEAGIEATEGLFLESNATLSASSFVSAVQNAIPSSRLLSPDAGVANVAGVSAEVHRDAAAGEGLVEFSLGLVGARSQAELLQRVADCFCHLLGDLTMRRRFLSASWLVAFAALLEEGLCLLSPGPGVMALLQTARPLVDAWRSRESASVGGGPSNRTLSKETASVMPAAKTAATTCPSVLRCLYCCRAGDPFASVTKALSRLLGEIEASIASFSAEESAVAVALVLAAPDSFLFGRYPLFLRTLQRALRLGRTNLPLANAAVASLRRWLQHHQRQRQGEEEPLLRAVLPLFRPFLAASTELGDNSAAAAARAALFQAAADAGFAESHLRSVASRLSPSPESQIEEGGDDASVPTGGWTPHIVSVRRSILLLLGDLGPQRALWLFGASRGLSLSGMLALNSIEKWAESGGSSVAPEMFLRISLPLGITPDAPFICLPVKGFIVSVAKAAIDAPTRQGRATLCEMLHALVCSVSQKAALALSKQPGGASAVTATHGSWASVQETAGTAAEAAAAAAAMAALYRTVLPSFLDLIATPDPVPRQLLYPLLLRSLRVSLEAALSPAPTPDPRLMAVVEVLTGGLDDDSASRRSAAAAAIVASISMVLQRLKKGQRSAGDAAAAAAPLPEGFAHVDEALPGIGTQRELLLLHRLLVHAVLLPLSYGSPAKRLGGIAVLSAVLPLGGRACCCAAARDILVATAFKALMVLLTGIQRRSFAKEVEGGSSYSCCCCLAAPSVRKEREAPTTLDCSAISVPLQLLQGVAVTGGFLVGIHREACLEEAAAASTGATDSAQVEEQPEMLGKTRRHRLLLQGQCLVQQLRSFALLCDDSGTRNLCRSLLLQLAGSSPTGCPAVAAVAAAAAAGAGLDAEKDWGTAAIEDMQESLEQLVQERSTFVEGRPHCRRLWLLLDGFCWVLGSSSAAFARVLSDTRLLQGLRTALQAVWVKGKATTKDVPCAASLQLAEATLRLCLLRQPQPDDKKPPSGAAVEDKEPQNRSLLLNAILGQPTKGARVSSLESSVSPPGPFQQSIKSRHRMPKEAEKQEGNESSTGDTQLSSETMVRSLIILLLQPSALGFRWMGASSIGLRRQAILVLKALAAQSPKPTSQPAGTRSCKPATSCHQVTATVKEWMYGYYQQRQQTQDEREGSPHTEGPPIAQRRHQTPGVTRQGAKGGSLPRVVAAIFPNVLSIGTQVKHWCALAELQAYVDGLEALEEVYGCRCFFEEAENKKLLVISTSPAAAVHAAVSAAADLLGGSGRGTLPEAGSFTTEDTTGAYFLPFGMTAEGGRRQLVALLLRLGLFFLRCVGNWTRGFRELSASITEEAWPGTPTGTLASLQEETRIFLSVAAFPLTTLVPPKEQTATLGIAMQEETAAETKLAVSFLSTVRMLRHHLFGSDATQFSSHYLHLLHVFSALVRRQTAVSAAPPAETAWGIPAASPPVAHAKPSEGDVHFVEEQELLKVMLDAFELWGSSNAWKFGQDTSVSSASAAMLPSLRRHQAALADLFLAVSSWRAFLKAMPFRAGALKFLGDITMQFLSDTVSLPTSVKAATLRGGLVTVLLADLLHEASRDHHPAPPVAAAALMAPLSDSPSQQQKPQGQRQEQQQDERSGEETMQAFAARRECLSGCLHSCSDGLSAMIAAVFPLTSADLRGIGRGGGAIGEGIQPLQSQKGVADVKTYAALLSAFFDATLRAFTAAADFEAEVSETAEAADAAETSLGASGRGEDREATGTDTRRRFYALSLCLTHLHDTLREEDHSFHPRVRRFLSSLVAVCSEQRCPRLRVFVLSHCLSLLLADMPPQHLLGAPHQSAGTLAFGGGAAVSLKRPPLGPRLVETLALPLLFASGSAKAAESDGSFLCEVWRLLWGPLTPLLSPQWEPVLSVCLSSGSGTSAGQVAGTAVVRLLQLFASACGFLEVLFCVTPLNLLKDSVASLVLETQHGAQTVAAGGAARAAPPVSSGPSPGAAVMRQVIAAMSSAVQVFEGARISLSHQSRRQQQEQKHAEGGVGGESAGLLMDSIRLWLWKARMRSYGCLTAVVCSTQSNASLYTSLLVSDSAGLPSLVDDELLSLAHQMLQQGDAALPLWSASDVPKWQQQNTITDPFSFASSTFSRDRRRRFGLGAESRRGQEETGEGGFTALSRRGGPQSLSQAFRRVGLGSQRDMFLELSQSIAQTRAREALTARLLTNHLIQQSPTPSQRFQLADTLASRWLQSLALAPAISSTFAAAEWTRISKAAAEPSSLTSGRPAARSSQERIEALLSRRAGGRREQPAAVGKAHISASTESTELMKLRDQIGDSAQVALKAARYSDAVGHSVLLQLLLRVVDCATVRFGPEWEASAPPVEASKAAKEPIGHSCLVHLPPLLQSLLRCCSSSRSTLSGPTRPDETDEDEDRAWALRLLLLRVFAQRADVLRPFAGRGLVDFVAESVADRRFLGAKRFHYWLRDIALLLIKWLQLPVQDGEEPSNIVETNANQWLLAPLLPLTTARLAAFAEALIRLSTSRDARTHKLNLLLVGTFLERLHSRVSLQASGTGIPLAPTALQGIPFIQLPLVSFFAYESSRSIEETASNRKLLLAAAHALLFPTASVAVQAAGACGSLLSVFPMEPLLPEESERSRQQTRSGSEASQLLAGIAFLSACHRRLQQLAAAEVAAENGKPPPLCGCVASRSRPPAREGAPTLQALQHGEREHSVGDEGRRAAEEEYRMKLMLYSFNYDGRYAASVAALATEEPLAFLGARGSMPRQTFLSMLSHLPLLASSPTTRTVSLKRREERKCVALVEAIRSICCCEVADEAAKAPGCAILAASFGMPGNAAEDKIHFETVTPVAPESLAIAQERLQEWQRECIDLLLEALGMLWGELLNPQRDSKTLLAAVSLLRSLLEKWENVESLMGGIQAMATLLKKPPSDPAVAAVLFEVCAWLRGHSQDYADSPALLAFMLGTLPHHPELRRRQLDYWFGDGAALPEGPSERISFLLSAGLSESSAPHMLHLLTAAICYKRQERQQQQPQEGPALPTREGTNVTLARPLAALAALLLVDRATLGTSSPTQPLPFARPYAADSTLSLVQEREPIWAQQRQNPSSLYLSLPERATLSPFAHGGPPGGAVRLPGLNQKGLWRTAKGTPLASDSSSSDEADVLLHSLQAPGEGQEGAFSQTATKSGRSGANRLLSRAAAVAMQERRSRKALALLHRHQKALAGREETVLLVRGSYTPGDPLRFVVSPTEALQLLGEACRLNLGLAAEFLLLAATAHSIPSRERAAYKGDEADVLGLASAGRHALERCCEDGRSSSRHFLSFLQRLELQALLASESRRGAFLPRSPLQLYELSRSNEMLDAALPLLEEMTCRQQQRLLYAAGIRSHVPSGQRAGWEAAAGLRPFFSALYLTYRDLGQFELQRSVLQLLALHKCFKKETIENLLRFMWDKDDAILRQQTTAALQWDTDGGEKEELIGSWQQHDENEEEPMARRLLRDAHLQSLQRMMQWKPLLEAYEHPLRSASQAVGGSGEGMPTMIQAARGVADVKQRIELGDGCLVRAALAVSLSAGVDSAAETLLTSLMRLLSPVHFLRADDDEGVSQQNFASNLPAPLKVSLCQLLALRAATKGMHLEASFLRAEAASVLQGLVVAGISTVPSAVLVSALSRLSLSQLIEKGISAIQEDRRRISSDEHTSTALEAFLSSELALRAPEPAGLALGESGAPFWRRIEAAPFSVSLDGMLTVFGFIGVTEQQSNINVRLHDSISPEGKDTEAAERRHLQLPWRLRCCAASLASRRLIRVPNGLRAATSLVHDMLQRQQQLQQQQVLHRWDLTLFTTVIRLKLREFSRCANVRSNAVARARQVLRLVQRETDIQISSPSGIRWSSDRDQEDWKELLIGLQLSCHTTVLHQLQRASSSVLADSSEELKAAAREAVGSLALIRDSRTILSTSATDCPHHETASGVADGSDGSPRGRLKCLWRCAALAKEILSSLQEAPETCQQAKSETGTVAATERDVIQNHSSVAHLFCSFVVELVASGGINSKYGRRGAALIPSVLLQCAEASSRCNAAIPGRSPSASQAKGDEKSKETDSMGLASSLGETAHETGQPKEPEGKSSEQAPETSAALQSRLTRLMAKIPVEVLSLYFPQLLSFVSADVNGCLTKALLPRLYEVIARYPHGAFYALQTATSAALRVEASDPQGCLEHSKIREQTPHRPIKLLDLLRIEALRQAPFASHFTAACELLQPPQRRLQQQLLQPLLHVLEATFGSDFNGHLQSEQRLPSFAAKRWRGIWIAACDAAVIDNRHAVLGEALDSHTKSFASRMQKVTCDFLAVHCGGSIWDLLSGPSRQDLSFAETTGDAVVKLPLSKLMALLELLSSEATSLAAGASREWRGILRLSDVSPWLAGCSSEWFSAFAGFDGNAMGPTSHRLPVPFSPLFLSSLKSAEVLSFCELVVALPSKQRPLRLSLWASDGYCYSFLVKGGEDLRLDQRVQTLMQLLAQLGHSKSFDDGLRLRSYGVIPMSEVHGIVEWISCTSPVRAICETYSNCPLAASQASMRYAAFLNDMIAAAAAGPELKEANSIAIADVWAKIFELPADFVEAVFKECVELAITNTNPAVAGNVRLGDSRASCCGCGNCSPLPAPPVPPTKAIMQCLMAIASTSEELSAFRKRFSASLAASGAVCYCLGIGDRHLGNCLLDLKTGELINIDFGYAFDVSAQALPVPEIAPFRLSPCLLDVIGPPGARDYALLHSPFFRQFKSDDEIAQGGYLPHRGDSSAAPTHAWVAGTLGLFESSFAEALEFVRSHRLVIENIVEMFVREPFAAYCEAAGRKAATWKLQERPSRDTARLGTPQAGGPNDSEGATQQLPSTRESLLLTQPLERTVELEASHCPQLRRCSMQHELRREPDQDPTVARLRIAFVKRKLRGEHPSLVLLDLLQSHCEPYVASAAASSTSILRAMVVGNNPPRARSSLLHPLSAGNPSEVQHPNYETRYLNSLEQARCLIEIATDPNILGRAWRGLEMFI